jgi:hypothetical protein
MLNAQMQMDSNFAEVLDTVVQEENSYLRL